MKSAGFAYKVHVEVVLTTKETSHLMELSERHYDGVCRCAGRQGGFLFGLNNRATFNEQDGTDFSYCLEIREVDTLCKILEGLGSDRNLAKAMSELLRSANIEQREMNRKSEGSAA
jgi:hypothetical protein